MTTIGQRIKTTRTSKKLTQSALANLVGVTREAVSQWESGDSKTVKPDNLLAVADALEVDIRWLITGKISRYIEQGVREEARPPVFSIEKMEALQLISTMPDDFSSLVLPFLRFNAENYGKKHLSAA